MKMGPLMIDLEGMTLSAREIAWLKDPKVGGVILFARNIGTIFQVKTLVETIRSYRQSIIIAIDQEGGRVQRIRHGTTRLPALRHLGHVYEDSSEKALVMAADWGWLMASEMLALGIDISFAPVLDIDYGHSEIIGDRAFHSTPEIIAKLAAAYIQGMHEAGMASTGKHFPGHGWVVADSHLAIPVDERTRQEIFLQDLQPFKLLGNQLDGIMPAHVIYSQVDDQPAGFSSRWLQDILRQKLGFDGVIFSDDLSMEGAAVAGGYPERARAALQAGCDMVLACNNPQGAAEILQSLNSAEVECNQARLQRMLARRKPDWGELTASDRYQVVQNSMEPFNA